MMRIHMNIQMKEIYKTRYVGRGAKLLALS